MSVNAIVSEGASIAIEKATSPNEYTTIPGIASISGPGGQAAVIDVSDLQSSAKEKRVGLTDSGQVTLEGSFIPNDAVQTRVHNAWKNREKWGYQITFTDSPASTFTFDAYVLGFVTSLGVDAKVALTVTLEIDGAVTLT